MFYSLLETHENAIALIDSAGTILSYRQLALLADNFALQINVNDSFAGKKLMLIEARNDVETIVAYLGALRAGHAVIMVDDIDKGNIAATFFPHAIYRKTQGQYQLINCASQTEIHPDLAVLLSTSGSTGSSKLVRLSHHNIDANARSIAQYLKLNMQDRALTVLPFFYSYGLSVLNSHLSIGATLLLSNFSVTDEKIWQFFRKEKGTSFAGVPYTFDLLDKSNFDYATLPSLKTITQAGGRLPEAQVKTMAKKMLGLNVDFYVMYGQTEATARIAYLPPAQTLEHANCIGISIPSGKLELEDENGNLITTADTAGELVYEGPNVMMGYAQHADDLRRPKEVFKLKTGDIACRNKAGLFYIVGRLKRFIKIFGVRTGLDEIELYFQKHGQAVIATGTDEHLVLAITDPVNRSFVEHQLLQHFKFKLHLFDIIDLPQMPVLASGKIDYQSLITIGQQKRLERKTQNANDNEDSICTLFEKILNIPRPQGKETFLSLNGDSLSYVEMSIELERYLGFLPDSWEKLSINELENMSGHTSHTSTLASDIFMRAIGILSVIIGHADIKFIGGGTGILFLVSGLNFARFQAPKIMQGNLTPILKNIFTNLYLPYAVITILYQLWKKNFQPSQLLLYSDALQIPVPIIFQDWYMQTLIQCLIFISLFIWISPVSRYAKQQQFRFGFILLLFSMVLFVIGFHHYELVSKKLFFMNFWLFAAGWCLHSARSHQEKLALSLVTGAFMLLEIFWMNNAYWIYLLIGLNLINWKPQVSLPKWVKIFFYQISAATLTLYLTHHFFHHFLVRRLLIEHTGIKILVTILGPLFLWHAYKWTYYRLAPRLKLIFSLMKGR